MGECDCLAGPRASRDRDGVSVLGVRVDPVTASELLGVVEQTVSEQRKAIVGNVNVLAANLAHDLEWFRVFLNGCDTVFCDGYGIQCGARLLGHHIPERITYAEWAWQLAAFAESNGFTIFLLGGRHGVAEKAAARLQAAYPALKVVGTHHGYFDKGPDGPENNAVVESINATRPNVLIVGFGMPMQERWLLENWGRLDANVALTGGAVFDYVSGGLRRGPRWMTDHGLEWLARLLIEPRRLWKRYLIGNPLFAWRILKQRLGLLRLSSSTRSG